MSEVTSRFALPFLVPGQGQKDVTHNEALEAVDALLHPLILSRTVTTPPQGAQAGSGWLVAAGATGDWAGRDGWLAIWTMGGWRFHLPSEGFSGWLASEGRRIRKTAAGWWDEMPYAVLPVSIDTPSGGGVIDVEARATVAAILSQLADVGLINRQ